MVIHCLLPFLRKLNSVCGPTRLLLFLSQKFVIWKQLRRFRKNRNCSLAQEFVNNIKFASYITGNRPLTWKRIAKRQRPSLIHELFFRVIFSKA